MKRPEYITTDLNGTVEEICRIFHNCTVKVVRNEDGEYTYSIHCDKPFQNSGDALHQARTMVEDAHRKEFIWIPITEM